MAEDVQVKNKDDDAEDEDDYDGDGFEQDGLEASVSPLILKNALAEKNGGEPPSAIKEPPNMTEGPNADIVSEEEDYEF